MLNNQRKKIKNDVQRYIVRVDKEDSYELRNEAIKILEYFGFNGKIFKRPRSRPIAASYKFVGNNIYSTSMPRDNLILIKIGDYNDFIKQIDENTVDDEFLDKIKKYSKNVYGKQ